MSLNNPLANAFAHIMNCERIGRKECFINPISKTIQKILGIMQEKGYIGDAKIVEKVKGGVIKIELLGNINKCGVTPRFSVKKENFVKFEKRYLPAKDFGILIVSTNKGLITHNEAKEKNIGGRLIGYCY